MRNISLFLLLFSLFSCGNKIEKPEKFLEKEDMTNLLYDLTLITSARSFYDQDSVIKNTSPQNVLNNYGLDSLSFVKLNEYYIKQPEVYVQIFDTINQRFKKQIETTELLPDDPRDTISKTINPLRRIKSFIE